MHKSDEKESARETCEESQSRSPGQMQFDVRKKENKKKNRCQSCMSTGISRKTENNGKNEPQKYCEEVYTDQDETREVQEKRIEYYRKKGDRQCTDDGRGSEITVDLVLQAKAEMSENKVNGPEDAVVNGIIQQLRCFQERFRGRMEAPSSQKTVKLVFLRKPDAEPQKGSYVAEPSL